MPSNEALIAEAKGLYARLQAGTLTDEDTLPVEAAIFEDYDRVLVDIRKNAHLFFKWFPHLVEPLAPFRVFGRNTAILEVGSHWGYSMAGIRHLGAKAQILSIEALPQNTQSLAALKTVERGRFDFRQVAATESHSELKVHIPAVNGVAMTGLTSSGATLVDFFGYHLADFAKQYPPKDGQTDRFQIITIIVEGFPIDEIVESAGVADKIRAIKMDIEGHEASALRGARRLLSRQKPFLMIENANRDLEVVAEMKSHGYQHYELHDSVLHLHEEQSLMQDGYWLHPQRLDFYRKSGLMA